TPIAGAAVAAWLYVLLQGGMTAQVPLADVLPLPRTDEHGLVRLRGFRRDARVQIGASHPDWQAIEVWSPAPWVEWSPPRPRVELRLHRRATIRWQLIADEVAVPADGTEFAIGPARGAPLAKATVQDGWLDYAGPLPIGMSICAFGPGCLAWL